MLLFGSDRGVGSPGLAWTILGVLATVQLSFTLILHHQGWTTFFYAVFSICLCVMAVGVAVTSLESIPQQIGAVALSGLLLTVSMSHLVRTKVRPPVDISVPIAMPAPITEAHKAGGERPGALPSPLPLRRAPSLITHPAPGLTVESRVDVVDGVHRLSWKLMRDGRSLRCGPLFMRSRRGNVEETLRREIEASVRNSSNGTLSCA